MEEKLSALHRYSHPVKGTTGGHGYMHIKGLACGHSHPQETRLRGLVTCPACLRKVAAGAVVEWSEPPRPKAWRLWNLRTAEWASDQEHAELKEMLVEKLARVKAADPRVQAFARYCLMPCWGNDRKYIKRRQAAFDARYPNLVARRAPASG